MSILMNFEDYLENKSEERRRRHKRGGRHRRGHRSY
jgi:hypothetical protein